MHTRIVLSLIHEVDAISYRKTCCYPLQRRRLEGREDYEHRMRQEPSCSTNATFRFIQRLHSEAQKPLDSMISRLQTGYHERGGGGGGGGNATISLWPRMFAHRMCRLRFLSRDVFLTLRYEVRTHFELRNPRRCSTSHAY